MFSHNGNDPISSSDQAFHCMPFDFESNININTTSSSSNSKQETNSDLLFPPFSFLHFPSPFEDDEIFLEQQHLDFLFQFQHQQLEPEPEPEPVVNIEVSKHIKTGLQIPRKRTGKRDRHSKINTARGPRDRRMRLSLEVARRFFGLQDLLGFDKASKTVEWLLNQAKVEINQLALKSVASSTNSECEGVSSLEEIVVNNGNKKKEMKEAQAVVKRKVKHSRRSAIFHPLARECRKRARERARERTKEKLRSKQCREEENNHKLMSQLGIDNPFGTGEECGTQSSQSVINPSLNLVTEAKKLSSLSKEHLRSTTVEANMMHNDSLDFVNKRSPSMILSSLNNSGLLQEISLN